MNVFEDRKSGKVIGLVRESKTHKRFWDFDSVNSFDFVLIEKYKIQTRCPQAPDSFYGWLRPFYDEIAVSAVRTGPYVTTCTIVLYVILPK